MVQRILVPLDGSPDAERAIPVAARIARAFGGSLILLHVVTPPVSSGKFRVPQEYPRVDTDEELAEEAEYLKTLAESDKLNGIAVERYTPVGAVAPAILSATQTSHATLVVLSRHGSTGYKRWALGSIAEKVIRHAAVPVMVIPAGGIEQVQADQQSVRTLLALDGSPLSEAILEPAASLTAALAQAAGQQGMVRLMRVVDIPPSYGKFRSGLDSFYDAAVRAEVRQEDEQYLRTIAARFTEGELAKYHLAVSSSVATDTDVAEALVQQAEQEHIDFIAMATHGRGGVQHWALGSITERVLHATKRPLFILRPQHGAVQTESMK